MTVTQNVFTEIFTVIPDSKSKIKSSSYLESGKYAVVDQGKELVAGFTNTSPTVVESSLPVIVFGDHTRAVKYVDFPFTAGADGTQILKPSSLTNPKYGFYLVLHAVGKIPSKGYARHFGELKKMKFQLPSLEKQRDIVEKLDKAFAEIDLLQVNLFDRESVIAEITAEKLDQIFRKKTEGASNSQQVALSEIARVINGRAYNQPELLKQGKYPVLRVGNFFSNRSWYYSDLELDKDKYCENGDLLYAWSASFGPRIWDGGKVIYHYHIWKVEEKKEMVLRDWLYWWFLWDVKQIKEAHGTGSTMMHVTKGAMENRVVQLPSLEMQSQQVREIAELQLATQKIESNYNDLAKKLLELKNAVLTSSFEEAVA